MRYEQSRVTRYINTHYSNTKEFRSMCRDFGNGIRNKTMTTCECFFNTLQMRTQQHASREGRLLLSIFSWINLARISFF